jgi:TetR/AcrR family transcriptional regulator, cholesterol catabolism regulator
MAKIRPEKNYSRKEAIIKNAAALFKTKGFSAASMRELAGIIGVEAPSLYNHIGSKSELLNSICSKVAGEFNNHLAETENKSIAVIEKIELITRFHITMMMNEFDEVFVANHEWKHLKEPFLSNFLNQRRNYEKRLVTIVEDGIKRKELKNINPYVAVLTLLSAVRGLEFWQRHKKNISAKVLEDDMVTHLLKGITK